MSHTKQPNNTVILNLIQNLSNKKTKPLFLGFTLVELIVVIVILAILATIAFLSFNSYSESAKDSKRMSNVVLMAKGFEVSISVGKYIDTSDVATSPNIVLSGSSVSYVGYYATPIKPKLLKSLGLWGGDINEIGTEDYNKYKFTYVPSIQKYQVASILSSKNNFHSYNEFGGFDSIGGISSLGLVSGVSYIDGFDGFDSINGNNISDGIENVLGFDRKVYAEEIGSGYIFLKGNYFSTGGIEGLIPKQEVWDFATGATKVIPGDKIVVNGGTNAPTDLPCNLSGTIINHLGTIDVFSEYSIVWNASYFCDDRKITRTCNNGVLSGDDSYRYSECSKGTPNVCSASGSFVKNGHTYSIPSLSHSSGAINILSSNISENNGVFKYTLSNIECNDGTYINVNESGTPSVVSCDSGYGINGNICSVSQNGSCNNSTPLGCSIGSAINDNGSVSCGTTRTWNCSGLYGGSSSVQCSKANAACPTSGAYTYGSWGSCSVSCGGGTQTRPQYCNYDSCYSAQPTSQSCNTQSCCTPSRQDYRTSCSASCGGGTTYHYQGYSGCGYSPSYVGSNSCNTQSCCTSGYARNNSYSACTKSVSFIMDCSDSSNAASWYKGKGRCGDTGGINYWNGQISVVGYSAANNQFNINYANDVAASGYGTNVTAYYNGVLCGGATYITNTNLCRE